MQLADALAAAHEQGVIDRDLKPGNIRITADGRLKILDFGLAKLNLPVSFDGATASMSESMHFAGTLPYMAPEQVRSEKLDARTDIWAAGAVLFEMATGHRPFRAPGLQVTSACCQAGGIAGTMWRIAFCKHANLPLPRRAFEEGSRWFSKWRLYRESSNLLASRREKSCSSRSAVLSANRVTSH